MDIAVAVFTRDLRLRDNPVLAAASAAGANVVPLFVLDPSVLAGSHGRPNRFGFLCEALADLDGSMRALGGSLVVREGDWVAEVLRVAHEARARRVHIARDVSGFAQRRLARLQAAAATVGVEVVVHDTLSVVAVDAFGKPFVMFTPYFRRWLAADWRAQAGMPKQIVLPLGLASAPLPRGTSPGSWSGGESTALAQAKAWTPDGLARYAETRDDPAADATSRLSPSLHFGCVSPLELAVRLRDRVGGDEFVRQLCWRDFFMQLLWWRPELAHTDLRPSGAPVWVNDPDEISAWKRGRTGYPLVDAGMRQLAAEGWMHNRVRMVAASFLTKDLRVDWRIGAAHFMDLLVDGDVAENQLNWQWVAGTGTDTNPFRVLSPTAQAKRHDSDGVYARRWIPELATTEYPAPIVDHHEAIDAWRASRGPQCGAIERERMRGG